MPKKPHKRLALLSALALVCALTPQSASALSVRPDDALVLVGLSYGSTALDGANLAN